MSEIADEQYQILFTFRCALRQFLRWSEQEAARVGMTAQQHQLLLAVRAHLGPTGPSIGDVADDLMIRHHSAVGLVGRVEAMGMLARGSDAHDQRIVRLRLTAHGHRVIEELTRSHSEELEQVAQMLHISEAFLNRLSEDFLERSPKEPA